MHPTRTSISAPLSFFQPFCLLLSNISLLRAPLTLQRGMVLPFSLHATTILVLSSVVLTASRSCRPIIVSPRCPHFPRLTHQ